MNLSISLQRHGANRFLGTKTSPLQAYETAPSRSSRWSPHLRLHFVMRVLGDGCRCPSTFGAILRIVMSSSTHQHNALMLSSVMECSRLNRGCEDTSTTRSSDSTHPIPRPPQPKSPACAQLSTARAVSFCDPNATWAIQVLMRLAFVWMTRSSGNDRREVYRDHRRRLLHSPTCARPLGWSSGQPFTWAPSCAKTSPRHRSDTSVGK